MSSVPTFCRLRAYIVFNENGAVVKTVVYPPFGSALVAVGFAFIGLLMLCFLENAFTFAINLCW
jgi:hypothetical protein